MKPTAQKLFAPLAAAGLALGLSACNVNYSFDGVPLAELEQGGTPPAELMVASGDTVIVTEGAAFALEVEGSADAVDELRFRLEEGSLAIGREGDDWKGGEKVTIRITMAAPREIDMAGSGKIQSATVASNADIGIAGSGNIEVAKIEAAELDISIAGSGNFKGEGSAERLDVSIKGAGDIDLEKLKAGSADISIAGSGDIQFESDGIVDVSIAGSGDVTVSGNATCTTSIMGSGNVDCKTISEQ